MNILDKFKQYKLKKQGFTINLKTRKLSNGKTQTYSVLKEISPTVVKNGVLTLPNVDVVSFNSISDLAKKTHISTIHVSSNIKLIEQQNYVYPFAMCHNLKQIIVDNEQPNSNYFVENGNFYVKTSDHQSIFSYLDKKDTLKPLKSVELIFSVFHEYNIPQTEKFNSVKTIKINNGAFAQRTRTPIINTKLASGQKLLLNPAKDTFLKFQYPETLIVNKQKINQSDFLLNNGRMLVEVENANNNLYVSHIDCSHPVEKFVNPDFKQETLADWQSKIK